MGLRFLCEGCECTIDSGKKISYTLIHNVTGERYVLCETCVRQITAPKTKQINKLLREIDTKHFKHGEKNL